MYAAQPDTTFNFLSSTLITRPGIIALSSALPPACARRDEPGWAALRDGWIESAGLGDVPAAHRAWACAFMLSDLAGRYTTEELKHVADALDEARAAAGDPA